jgi:hypothetical protein
MRPRATTPRFDIWGGTKSPRRFSRRVVSPCSPKGDQRECAGLAATFEDDKDGRSTQRCPCKSSSSPDRWPVHPAVW